MRVRLRATELRGSQVGSQRAGPSVGAVSAWAARERRRPRVAHATRDVL